MAAMEMRQDDIERFMYFDELRQKAADEYLRSPHDPENLTSWGGALLELAHFQQGSDSLKMVQDAISKMEEALRINPKRHQTLWNLGNANASHGFLMSGSAEANEFFKKATVFYQKAFEEEPLDLYAKSLEIALKAPEWHQQIQNDTPASSSARGSSKAGKKKKKRKSNLKYDIIGWIVLGVGLIAIAKTSMVSMQQQQQQLQQQKM